MKALKIETDGTMQVVEITGKTEEEQNHCIYGLIGGYFEIVRLSRDAVMLVDEDGLIKGLKQNPLAMIIAEYPMLVGTALVIGMKRTPPDDEEFVDCPERFLRFADKINTMMPGRKDESDHD